MGDKIARVIKSLEEVLVENSTYCRGQVKARLISNGMLRNQCYVCDQLPVWCGKPLTLILDHVNGVNNDHRFENLRLLCPNCNSQQDTFAGRNQSRENQGRQDKCDCGKDKWRTSKTCRDCQDAWRARNRPSKQELDDKVKDVGCAEAGRFYGVSHTTVQRWLNMVD
jgi:hypothetical protein